MSKLIVANWKMNLNPHEASLLVHRLDEKVQPNPNTTVVICPPFVDLYPMSREINKDKFRLGSQNIHYLDEGPFTGEISPSMLKGLVNFAIIGHSERRQQAGEDDKLIAKKVSAAARNSIVPILCVGETALDRQHDLAKKVVTDQLSADVAMITAEEVANLVVAYEPVWAIGSGQFAKPEEVTPMIEAIRTTLEQLFGESVGSKVSVLYGGSVSPDNAQSYLALPGVDGLLVGGASLNYEQFAAIVAAAQTLPQ